MAPSKLLRKVRRARITVIVAVLCFCAIALGQAPATQPAVTEEPKLIAHYPLAGNAKDATEFGHDGEATDLTPTADHLGHAKAAMHFNGKSSQIVIDPPPMIMSGQITVALWVKPEFPAKRDVWTDVMDGNGKFTDPIIGQDDGYHVRCWQLWCAENRFCWHRMAEFSSVGTAKPIEPNTWHHVAATFDGRQHRLYMDGKLVHQADGIFKANATEAIRMGAKGDGTTPKHIFFTGDLSDVRIYDGALPAEKIVELAK